MLLNYGLHILITIFAWKDLSKSSSNHSFNFVGFKGLSIVMFIVWIPVTSVFGSLSSSVLILKIVFWLSWIDLSVPFTSELLSSDCCIFPYLGGLVAESSLAMAKTLEFDYWPKFKGSKTSSPFIEVRLQVDFSRALITLLTSPTSTITNLFNLMTVSNLITYCIH